MTLNNGQAVVINRKTFYLSMVIFLTLLPLILITNWFNNIVPGISTETWAVLVIAAYIIFNLYRFYLNLTFINYSDEGDKLVFKYYVIRTFSQKYKTIELPKSQFCKFTIETSVLGRFNLVLYQQIGKRVAKYPAISLTALKATQRNSLIQSLNSNIISVNKG